MNDPAELKKFAQRYADAWCTHDLIAESKGNFDAIEYQRQLREGVN